MNDDKQTDFSSVFCSHFKPIFFFFFIKFFHFSYPLTCHHSSLIRLISLTEKLFLFLSSSTFLDYVLRMSNNFSYHCTDFQAQHDIRYNFPNLTIQFKRQWLNSLPDLPANPISWSSWTWFLDSKKKRESNLQICKHFHCNFFFSQIH